MGRFVAVALVRNADRRMHSKRTHPLAIRSIGPGLEHVVVANGAGQVYDWGLNDDGQLGNGLLDPTAVPQHVLLPTRIKAVGAGQHYSLALSSNGRRLFAWGDNRKGELGIGRPHVQQSTTPRRVDIPLAPGETIKSIADGGNGAFALLSNGQVLGWGNNDHAQTGRDPRLPNRTYTYKPHVIPGLSNVVALAAGDHQALALASDGTVWAWGANRYGQLGPQGPNPRPKAIHVRPIQVTGLPPIVAIAAGGEDSLALDAQGNVWSWGRNGLGELGWGVVDHSDGPHPIPQMAVGITGIVSLHGEGPTTLAADASGNVYAWGFNRQGQAGQRPLFDTGTPHRVLTIPESPDKKGPSVDVGTGHWFDYAYNAVTGQAYAWGRDTYGELRFKANDRPHPTPIDLGHILHKDPAVCFASGTHIRTAHGETPVEQLRAGDRVSTSDGALRPVLWVGHRQIDCRRHADRAAVLPIGIRAHAFGPNRPSRDLFVSPGHAICVDVMGEILVPASALVDGESVRQIEVDAVTYWHVELDRHDVLFANDLPAESYLEMGNRGFFVERTALSLFGRPDAEASARSHADFCRPFVDTGPLVEAIRARLRRFAGAIEPGLRRQAAEPEGAAADFGIRLQA